jgi:hypothetical protein
VSEYRRELRTHGDIVGLGRELYAALAPEHAGLDLTTPQRERRRKGTWSNDGAQEGERRWELGDDSHGLALFENVEVRDHHAVFAHHTTTLEITSRGLPAGHSLRLHHDSRSSRLVVDVRCPATLLATIERIVSELAGTQSR